MIILKKMKTILMETIAIIGTIIMEEALVMEIMGTNNKEPSGLLSFLI